MPVQQSRNVAIFLDMENLFGGYGNDVAAVPLAQVMRDIEAEVARSGLGGGTALARAYANWARPDMAGYRSQLLAGNIKPVQVFSFDHSSKNAADIELVVDALEVAADMPWIELFVIVSGDGDFVPLIRRLHALGKRSFVATTSQPAAGIVNRLLPSVADYFHRIEVPPAPAANIIPAVVQATPKSSKAAAAKKTPATKPPPAKKAPAATKSPSAKKVPAAHPELKLYQASVHDFVKKDPTLWVNGQVNAQRLGTLLRKRWPDITYKTFGFATLTRFVEESCGLKTIKPAAAGASK
ncbi:NYN domain-containing protein [Pseudarthrobacter sp. DSP2-3-2b1]|uniref:NYN domain-containing protein n=1 Tax=Pseudarthrobacter sp. DSP2-3-2b1 TaxID=2804661 RepID=UPI003CF28E74